MKFRGLIVTDAMDMGGVTSLYAPGEAAVRSVEAGADVLLMPPVPDAAMAGLEAAVEIRPHLRDAHRRIRAPHSGGESAPRARQAALRRRRAPQRKIRAAGIRSRSAEHRRPRRHASARLCRNCCRSTPRARCACCSSRFPPIPIRIPGETIEPEIRPRVDSLTVLARGHAIFKRRPLSSFPSRKPTTSLSLLFSCAWPTAKATSASPTISAPS